MANPNQVPNAAGEKRALGLEYAFVVEADLFEVESLLDAKS